MLIKFGSHGPDVRIVQNLLTHLGFDTKGVDGYFGQNTLNAVLAFQRHYNLIADGIVGNETYSKLKSMSDNTILKDKEMKAYQIAMGEIGVKDILGPKSNNQVLKYFEKTGNSWVKDDDTSWCAAFVGYCLEMAGIASTKKLNARSYLTWGIKSTSPKLGDIVVLWRISPTSDYGHVAFFVNKDDNYVYLLGGNQADEVKVSRYPLTQVLDYRTITN